MSWAKLDASSADSSCPYSARSSLPALLAFSRFVGQSNFKIVWLLPSANPTGKAIPHMRNGCIREASRGRSICAEAHSTRDLSKRQLRRIVGEGAESCSGLAEVQNRRCKYFPHETYRRGSPAIQRCSRYTMA